MKKTHYIENGKTLCGLPEWKRIIFVDTKTRWYDANNKCSKCKLAIKNRTVFI